jgi:chromosome segregation ATPase
MKDDITVSCLHKNKRPVKKRKVRYRVRLFVIVFVFIKARVRQIYKYIAILIFSIIVASSNQEMVAIKNVNIKTVTQLTLINRQLRSTENDLVKSQASAKTLEKKNLELKFLNTNLKNSNDKFETEIYKKCLELKRLNESKIDKIKKLNLIEYQLKNEQIRRIKIEKMLHFKLQKIKQLKKSLIANKQYIFDVKIEKEKLELSLNNSKNDTNFLEQKLQEKNEIIQKLLNEILIQENDFKEQLMQVKFEVNNMSLKMTMFEKRQFLAPILQILDMLSKKKF